MSDDIIDQLSYYVANEMRMPAGLIVTAIDEIERLREQVDHAHAILASEGASGLVVGSNHESSWRQALTPAVESYWRKYGNYFKEARND